MQCLKGHTPTASSSITHESNKESAEKFKSSHIAAEPCGIWTMHLKCQELSCCNISMIICSLRLLHSKMTATCMTSFECGECKPGCAVSRGDCGGFASVWAQGSLLPGCCCLRLLHSMVHYGEWPLMPDLICTCCMMCHACLDAHHGRLSCHADAFHHLLPARKPALWKGGPHYNSASAVYWCLTCDLHVLCMFLDVVSSYTISTHLHLSFCMPALSLANRSSSAIARLQGHCRSSS